MVISSDVDYMTDTMAYNNSNGIVPHEKLQVNELGKASV